MRRGPDKKKRAASGAALRFIADALASETDACIVWPFGLSGVGYPKFNRDGRTTLVTRYVCAVVHGEPREGEESCHTCHEPLCINKRHLKWGLHVQNEADKCANSTNPIGIRNPRARLTEAQVLQIRTQPRADTYYAAKFNVKPRTIEAVRLRENWRHL